MVTPPEARVMANGEGTQMVARVNSEMPQSPPSLAMKSKPL